MRVLIIGFSVSRSMFERVLATDRGMPVQTQRFGWALVESLGANGVEVDLVVAEPVADFPHNRRLLIRGQHFTEAGVAGRSVSFVNLPAVKNLTRYWSGRRAARLVGVKNADAVLVHGVHSAFLWLALGLGKRHGIPTVAVLTDAPSLHTKFDNALTSLLKRLDRRLILAALRRLDGVVALTPGLSELAAGRPAMLMEGIAISPRDVDGAPLRTVDDLPRVVYAGGLSAEYGVLDLLDSVEQASEVWTLEFFGRGPAVAAIQEAERQGLRVAYRGSVAPDEMARVYASSDVLVNPRPPHGALAHQAFPSKLLEYLASGVPVVTTELPTLPRDYLDHVTLAASSPPGLAAAIDGLVRAGSPSRERLGSDAKEFILRTRGVERQGERLKSFIADLSSGTWQSHRGR
jgi:glycosyltransferase involved in cell wall biosynthesis